MNEITISSNKGQAHTTEAVLASLLILGGLLFAIQTTAVTPFSSTTEDHHLENQQRETIRNAVAIAHQSGDMKQTVLNWNTTENTYSGTEQEFNYYTDTDVNTPFITHLSDTLDQNKVVYNINIHYYNTTTGGDTVQTQRLLRVGSPSNNAISVRRPLTLHDTDRLTNGANPQLQNTGSDEFYIETINSTTPIYNQIEVEVVAWRR